MSRDLRRRLERLEAALEHRPGVYILLLPGGRRRAVDVGALLDVGEALMALRSGDAEWAEQAPLDLGLARDLAASEAEPGEGALFGAIRQWCREEVEK
ncbi:hypothetical protein [Sphaerobacter thermophilus]|uniref:Uncharacterized protein n=1 Tax=Sphaerobacter thermophilus (strain ATCC 49802 / DSM 20745 / KCCM 41009 / NCIMB 13125 / S 6022) TaxID=479434 RepID=D1C3U9_SPHTD|nr:hypothetical protein [Sphaerobacter thermophilus]ACZ38916.1 hypothetical protein Sthe_1481 [Sphaerobacter thermophilus DSM 20745]ACZ39657.1 hypothetical protein Sthe_2235 [Sphaerobacter thermophilus DSM 20745]MBX6723078.1 hypothetical protein [Dactylosporangium sp.]